MMRQQNLNGAWEFLGVPLAKEQWKSFTSSELHALIESDVFAKRLHRKRNWLAGRVPGDNIQDLLRAGKLPHPFEHRNVRKLAWTERRLWCYRRTFKSPRNIVGRLDLVFEGLDTFATVFVNGQVVGRVDNMHRPWRFDVSRIVRLGEDNEVLVVFHPWQIHTRGKDVSDQWAPFCKERVWMRKAQMETGWDWGPRIVLSGIWRSVRLEAVPEARIAAWQVRTCKLSDKQAHIEVDVELDRETRRPMELIATLRKGRKTFVAKIETRGEKATLPLRISDPKLWWPRNLGTPNLYDVTIEARRAGHTVDTIEGRAGIRTVSLLQEPQGQGCRSCTLVVNGRKTYMGGVNWVPAHSMISSVTHEDYRQRLQAAADANMNTIRVWGGGIYENEAFYNLCDELGLMVWQDFMFACATYPWDDPEFAAGVEQEFEHAIRRLRVHPSVVLWNGSNECQWLDEMVHWEKPDHVMPDRPMYEKVLPKLLRRLDGTRPYMPSSPYGGNDDNDWRQGTQHSYKVWVGVPLPRKRGEAPGYPKETDFPEVRHYKHYADVVPRFVSEFSAQGLPYEKTLRAYLRKDEMSLSSSALYARDRHTKRLQTCKSFLAGITGWGKTYAEIEMKTQFAQARAMEFGICHHRQHLWQCSGSLVWQLNDCWPGFSWSLLDFHLLPKPAYFAIKRALAPRLLTLVEKDGVYSLWGVNTSGKTWKGRAGLTVGEFTGRVLGQSKMPLDIPNDESRLLVPDVLAACKLDAFDARHGYIKAEILAGPQTHPAWHVEDPIRIDLPATTLKTTLDVRNDGEGFRHSLNLTSDTFALFAGVIPPDGRCVFEDNFINIEPGRPTEIVFHAPKKYSRRQIRIRSYNG